MRPFSILRGNSIAILLFLSIALFTAPVLFSQNDLNQKIMMGYQGWFLAQGDGSPANDWRHWFKNSNDPSAEQLNIDNWPDMSEYEQTYATNLTYNDGSTARLYSAYNLNTTKTHFRWMQEYNVYGVYLQRFLGEAVNDARFFQVRNRVLENVIGAAVEYDRHFALMYDITGVPEDGLFDKLVNDWQYLVDTYDLLNQTGYVKQDGRPVIAIWGMGFPHNEVTPETSQDIIDYFHTIAAEKYRAYVVGGVPGYWRTLDNDSKTEPAWAGVYRSLDMISPWTVGRYNKSSVDSWKTGRIVPDLAECTANGIDYMPVIFPGGSWFNLSGHADSTRINDNPRDGGNLYWRQAYNAISAGVQFLYVAMFDEVDEGTAMFKLAPNDSALPAQGTLVPLDADGYSLPSDWYLRLANESQKMLDQSIPLTSEMPITPQKIAVTSVSLSPATATLAVGSTIQLKAATLPEKAFDKTILWSSSETSVATVTTNGKVEAKGLGTASITATTQDGGLTAVCLVTVAEGKPVAGVAVSPAFLTINVGETGQLFAAIEPADALNKAVRWITSDIKVAVVDSTGLVSAVAEGEATITARTQDGDKSDRANITVVNPAQKPYRNEPLVIPGVIEAEDFDLGGEGVAYHDQDVSNSGNQYRRTEGVDIEACSEGGYSVGWFNSGEWLEYTINVPEAGRYDMEARVATQLNGAKFHLEFDGRTRSGILDVPNTGGWQTWQSIIKKNILLLAGLQVMRIYREVDGADFNINKLIFTNPTGVAAEPVLPDKIDLYPAFPNPFNAATTIRYAINKNVAVKLVVYDVLGKEIKTLVDAQQAPGLYAVHWDSKNEQNIAVASGLYFVRLAAEEFVKTNKLLLVK